MCSNPENPKNPKKYSCINCDYYTDSKKDFNKHLDTAKHKKNLEAINKKEISNIIIPETNETNETNENKIYSCINCERKFKSNSGLWRHKQKCEEKEVKCEEIEEEKKVFNGITSEETIMSLIQENKDIKQLLYAQNETTNKLIEMIPKINNTTNNNTINNNQRLNINVFLNEHCKDAINMSDFIKSIEVSLEQLDYTKTQGLEKGISNVIMENMNKLSLYERPIHCTDTKRETLYIKDNDKWEKDKSKEKIKKIINKTSNKNYTALINWRDANPDWLDSDDKGLYYAKAMSVLGKPLDEIDDKIVKKICNNTYIKDNLENDE
tara:strand:- start:4073 stop:5041 length:969 start_codon:yes stop_codon:yes gene_type:complete